MTQRYSQGTIPPGLLQWGDDSSNHSHSVSVLTLALLRSSAPPAISDNSLYYSNKNRKIFPFCLLFSVKCDFYFLNFALPRGRAHSPSLRPRLFKTAAVTVRRPPRGKLLRRDETSAGNVLHLGEDEEQTGQDRSPAGIPALLIINNLLLQLRTRPPCGGEEQQQPQEFTSSSSSLISSYHNFI